MAKKKKEEKAAGAPEWMVTFGDMMSLLLCFFVIIVSMSEVKKDVKFQVVVDSIQQAFGYSNSPGQIPEIQPSQNSLIQQLQKIVIPQYTTKEGDSDDEGINGRVFRVTNVREGISIVVGGRITFERFKAKLKPEAQKLIRNLSEKIVGRNTVLHVRGHTTREPLPPDSEFKDQMHLSLTRAQAVADELVANGVRSIRIRIIGCGASEPLLAQAYEERRLALNRRVEVIVTEAIVEDYAGEPQSQEVRESEDGS